MTTQLKDVSVLVVDDNDMNIDLIVNMLDRYQYTSYTALNGEAALALVKEKMPEIVLLDIGMPVMDGYEVCRRIKADEQTADIPVMFISAFDDTDDIIKGFDVGAVDYITKPFKYLEVIARINTQVTLLRQKREIEAMRERERQQYENMDKLRRQFIGSATHDMKNPLFVISGYADMIEMGAKANENPQMVKFVESIRRGVNKMSDLVYDILELLQLETQSTIEKETIDLEAFMTPIIADMRMRGADNQVSVTFTPPEEKVTIQVDASRLQRVLDNLISNAIKYNNVGGSVDVTCRLSEKSIVVEVADDGLGIPPEMQASIFEPFQRVNTEEHMSKEGTGLGLSIVKTLVEQHDGTIELQSKMGDGSRFIITLPR